MTAPPHPNNHHPAPNHRHTHAPNHRHARTPTTVIPALAAGISP